METFEDRFGRYRQLSGAQYDLSLRQLYEPERNLRLQKLLIFRHEEDQRDEDRQESTHHFPVVITDADEAGSKYDTDPSLTLQGTVPMLSIRDSLVPHATDFYSWSRATWELKP